MHLIEFELHFCIQNHVLRFRTGLFLLLDGLQSVRHGPAKPDRLLCSSDFDLGGKDESDHLLLAVIRSTDYGVSGGVFETNLGNESLDRTPFVSFRLIFFSSEPLWDALIQAINDLL